MAAEIGQPIGLCECGCGEITYEKIYRYKYRSSNPMVKRPTRLPGHSKPPANWVGRSDMVSSDKVIELLLRFKRETGMSWKQLTELFGFTYNVEGVVRHRYISKKRAAIILREIRDYTIKNRDWRELRV